MSAANPAVVTVQPRDRVVFQTLDCFDGQVSYDAQPLSCAVRDRFRANPATGPVAIAGARPGMTLKVHIEKITVAPRGVVFDCTVGSNDPPGRLVPILDDSALFADRFTLPLQPVIGTIGVAPAPEQGAIPDTTPGDHGGNLDTKDITVGAAVYLPVFVEGALLGVGDLHGVQGDGDGNC